MDIVVDWEKLPSWINYVAMDKYGDWWGYEKKPIKNKYQWSAKTGDCTRIEVESTQWEKTLLERP